MLYVDAARKHADVPGLVLALFESCYLLLTGARLIGLTGLGGAFGLVGALPALNVAVGAAPKVNPACCVVGVVTGD